MGYRVKVECVCENAPHDPVRVTFHAAGVEDQEFVFVPPDEVGWEHRSANLSVGAENGDHWVMFYPTPGTWVRGKVLALPQGPWGWWHRLHNVTGAPTRALRIGVVDESLPYLPPEHPLGHVLNLGGEAWNGVSDRSRAYRTLGWNHGLIVCSLLAARPKAPTQFSGIAPEAEVLFMAAGMDNKCQLDPVRLMNAIEALSHDYQCDILSISAGAVSLPTPDILDAVVDANRAGTLCFFAAGNDPGPPGYPACYPECVAVGAVGSVGWAPQGTFEELREKTATERTAGLFLWSESATGDAVDFLGGGVAVCSIMHHGHTETVTGTSYATPITAGVASRILARDATYSRMAPNTSRVTHALNILQKSVVNPFPGACKYGIMCVR